jgi:hypothetical protein
MGIKTYHPWGIEEPRESKGPRMALFIGAGYGDFHQPRLLWVYQCNVALTSSLRVAVV